MDKCTKGQDSADAMYKIFLIDSGTRIFVFPQSLITMINRMGWTFEYLSLRGKETSYYESADDEQEDNVLYTEEEQEEYDYNLSTSLNILKHAKLNPRILVFNGAAVDQLWLGHLEIDEDDENYISTIIDLLKSSNVITLVDSDDIPEQTSLHHIDEDDDSYLENRNVSNIRKILQELQSGGSNIVCFDINSLDVQSFVLIKALDFIDSFTDGFLRLYVSEEGYQAEQLNGFVRLFESYLNRVEACPVHVDSQRTDKGTLYVFRLGDDSDVFSADLPTMINRFDQFMALCKDDPDTAADFVSNLGISQVEAVGLVGKYARRYTRLQMDMRHERAQLEANIQFQYESRRRSIQQQFEVEASELAEGKPLTFDAVPTTGLGVALLPTTGSPSIIVNMLDKSPEAHVLVREIVNNALGGMKLTPEQVDIVRILQERAMNQTEAISLEADFQVLHDETAHSHMRKGAMRRLKDFAERNKDTLADAAFRALIDYLPKALSG